MLTIRRGLNVPVTIPEVQHCEWRERALNGKRDARELIACVFLFPAAKPALVSSSQPLLFLLLQHFIFLYFSSFLLFSFAFFLRDYHYSSSFVRCAWNLLPPQPACCVGPAES